MAAFYICEVFPKYKINKRLFKKGRINTMKCKNCGAENQDRKFCGECGAQLEEETSERSPTPEETDVKDKEEEGKKEKEEKEKEEAAEEKEEEEKAEEVKDALDKLEKYEEGTITHPKDKPKKKGKFWYPKNPMLWSFLWLLAFAAALAALSLIFFNIDLSGTEIVFGIVFSIFTAGVAAIDFIYYFPASLSLDKLLKGKGARLEYRLKDYEIVDLAEKAKKRNRGFYLAIGLFGLAFTIYHIYFLVTAISPTTLNWISLIFSICVFVIFALLFIFMPKLNYGRMMENGSRVIIGSKSVYYGGNYYHWSKINPDATFGNLNTKKHELELTFTQEFKNGNTKRKRVSLYAPDSAIAAISKLLNEYESTVKNTVSSGQTTSSAANKNKKN